VRAVTPDAVSCSACAAVDGVTRARAAGSTLLPPPLLLLVVLLPASGRFVIAERNALSSRRGATRGVAVVTGLRSGGEPAAGALWSGVAARRCGAAASLLVASRR
jgi:hypothetical protein